MGASGLGLPAIATLAGIIASTYGAVYSVFSHLDSLQSDANRAFVAQWLKGVTVSRSGWDTFFIHLFDRVYGRRHFSIECARRSSLQTILYLVAGQLYIHVYHPDIEWRTLETRPLAMAL